VHISKDDVYDDNNNVARLIHQDHFLMHNRNGLSMLEDSKLLGKISPKPLETLFCCQTFLHLLPMLPAMVFMLRTNQLVSL